ncbi:MAG: hypothetical protein WA432_04740 [Candidatus Babeliaceae bacterium]
MWCNLSTLLMGLSTIINGGYIPFENKNVISGRFIHQRYVSEKYDLSGNSPLDQLERTIKEYKSDEFKQILTRISTSKNKCEKEYAPVLIKNIQELLNKPNCTRNFEQLLIMHTYLQEKIGQKAIK